MPYYIGDVIKDEKKLIARTPEKFRETGIDVRIDSRVEEVDEKAGEVRLADGTRLPLRYPRPRDGNDAADAGDSGGDAGRGLHAEEV